MRCGCLDCIRKYFPLFLQTLTRSLLSCCFQCLCWANCLLIVYCMDGNVVFIPASVPLVVSNIIFVSAATELLDEHVPATGRPEQAAPGHETQAAPENEKKVTPGTPAEEPEGRLLLELDALSCSWTPVELSRCTPQQLVQIHERLGGLMRSVVTELQSRLCQVDARHWGDFSRTDGADFFLMDFGARQALCEINVKKIYKGGFYCFYCRTASPCVNFDIVF